jgi:hypothetical protein
VFASQAKNQELKKSELAEDDFLWATGSTARNKSAILNLGAATEGPAHHNIEQADLASGASSLAPATNIALLAYATAHEKLVEKS